MGDLPGSSSDTDTDNIQPYTFIHTAMLKTLLSLCVASTAMAQQNHHLTRPLRTERLEVVEVVEPVVATPEPSLLARIVGEETQGKVVDSIISWARDKAKENPGCVERFVCEMYKTGETMNGIPYILMSITNAAVSYTVAEQFNQSIEMEAITRSSRIGRSDGTCHHMECPLADGRLREVTDWLAGFEEMLGYIVNSVSTSLG